MHFRPNIRPNIPINEHDESMAFNHIFVALSFSTKFTKSHFIDSGSPQDFLALTIEALEMNNLTNMSIIDPDQFDIVLEVSLIML